MSAPVASFGPPARQSDAEDVVYISICSGGAAIKSSATERPKYILGQLIVLGVAIFVVSLVDCFVGRTGDLADKLNSSSDPSSAASRIFPPL
jgi:hypothetical protein